MAKIQKIQGPTIQRTGTLDSFRSEGEGEAETRTVELSFSSTEPYTRSSWFDEPWVEVLRHDEKSINMQRLNNGAPVLRNHDTMDPDAHIGVVEKAWIDGTQGKATVRLSQRSGVDDLWRDINDGIVRNVSVGYQIQERSLTKENKDGPNEYEVTRWSPMEISILTGAPPADPTVGIGRSDGEPEAFTIIDEEPIMATKDDTTQAAPVEPTVDTAAIEQRAAETALKREQTRRTNMRNVFEHFAQVDGVAAIMEKALDDHSVTIEQAREQLLDHMGKNSEPVGAANHDVRDMGSEKENFKRGVEAALCERTGMFESKPEDAQNHFRGFTLVELARKSLEMNGIADGVGGKMDMLGRAISHSSSDFPILLQNVANKSMLKGWDENVETFEPWTAAGSLPDFKVANRVDMNLYPNLPLIPEGSEYTYATIGERGETIMLYTHGSIFSITRQALINDDMSMFTRIPQRQGRAASRTVADMVYNQLTSNPLMSDGTALFDASHGNLAAPGGVPTTQSLDAGRVAMMTQKDPDNIASGGLNIRPAYALVPAALEGEMKTVLESQYEVRSATSRANTTPNSVRGMVSVISDARLDADSSLAWYLAGSPSQYDTIEVSYLDGNRRPYMEQKQGWSVDGAEFKIRIDVGCKALDYRALYKNPGE